jgi:tRNA-dihydrouridine synthase A
VDEQDPQAALPALVDECARRQTIFAVHARKAWLTGLSPKENATCRRLIILVYALKRKA